MKPHFIIILLSLILSSCSLKTDVDSATEVLKAAGLEPIEVGGYGWFDCSEDDFYATRFKAKNPQGMIVEGCVCQGFFKGKTIRYD